MKRGLRIAGGVIMLVLGCAGLIMPILQGWLFIAIGCVLLSPDIEIFRRVLAWVKRRFPRTKAAVEEVQDKVRDDGVGDNAARRHQKQSE